MTATCRHHPPGTLWTSASDTQAHKAPSANGCTQGLSEQPKAIQQNGRNRGLKPYLEVLSGSWEALLSKQLHAQDAWEDASRARRCHPG